MTHITKLTRAAAAYYASRMAKKATKTAAKPKKAIKGKPFKLGPLAVTVREATLTGGKVARRFHLA